MYTNKIPNSLVSITGHLATHYSWVVDIHLTVAFLNPQGFGHPLATSLFAPIGKVTVGGITRRVMACQCTTLRGNISGIIVSLLSVMFAWYLGRLANRQIVFHNNLHIN